jgi:hypothetical protein
MTYRSDTDALEARLDVLEKDLADRTRERDDVAHMLAEARGLDAARRWLEDRPRRHRRRIMLAAIASTMMLLGGLITFFVVRHDPKRDREEQVLRQFQGFTDDMCKCTEAKCAQSVSDRMTKWGAEISKDYDNNKPSEELVKRASKVAEQLTACMSKAMTTP